MKNFTSIIALFLLLFSFTTQSQTQQTTPRIFGKPIEEIERNPENGLIRCVTPEYEKALIQSGNAQQIEEFEAWLAPKIEEYKQQRLISSNSTNNIITIPVVVHVVHSGQSVGTGSNISDARVLSQITVLNQDYRREEGTPGFNTNAVGADVEIEFCLAQRDPFGDPTTGIVRYNYGNTVWNESNVENTLKPQTQWNPNDYLNIWVCQFGGDLNGVLGYAQFPTNSGLSGLPGSGSASRDGVIIDWRCFGNATMAPGTYMSGYNRGRTTTHEIGHFLGLRHIWGDNNSCSVNTTDSMQDYCPDTPPSAQPNYSCGLVNSCPASGSNDMVENYMDYTNDTCMNIFTQNQKTRIRTVLQNSPRRSTLGASLGCQAPTMSSQEFEWIQSVYLYPNPTESVIHIASSANSNMQPESYIIYNSLGQSIETRTVTSESDLSIRTSHLKSGVYFIRIIKETESKTLQFIKK